MATGGHGFHIYLPTTRILISIKLNGFECGIGIFAPLVGGGAHEVGGGQWSIEPVSD